MAGFKVITEETSRIYFWNLTYGVVCRKASTISFSHMTRLPSVSQIVDYLYLKGRRCWDVGC
jgi:hypothetical protein